MQSTYCHGFNIEITSDITKNEFLVICGEITECMNDENVIAKPERVNEGGIQFFHKNDDKYYKSLRFNVCNPGFMWPHIPSEFDNWGTNDVLLPAKAKGGTFLKAFRTAPAWTRTELDAIRNVLISHSVKVTKMPIKV